ncbi:FtsQ-type POTRA domain-containing protein [Microbacterium sp. CFBP9034]|uniref:FtsQ-type POTRA domain-containing protein n=1 Tax=Microbacterium sp. CFBP9034 TaxID=3096540 RepID=UPI002A69F8A5|nr:FtsQ-type POTRA domain-containing protein [Microbacterium sp. CFBP9034]MDY0909988.1 cell division protein FtsQ/DivIB [Microbacterium sp. CFBP9034]
MRRPSPLPSPPARGPERSPAPDKKPASEPSAAESGTVGQSGPLDASGAVGATAPIIPLSAPTPLPLPAGVGEPDAISTADEPVGLREVWQAARARRKALRAEVRRFTVRQRRRRALWLGAAASVVVLALATLGAAYSPLFAVQTITVIGAAQLDEAVVEAALADQLGTPMPLVDESAVKAALITFPLVESYTLEARPPHELVVRLVERTPIGLIETRAGYTLVDAAGVALSTSASPSAGVPVLDIRGGAGSEAFTAAGQVMHSLPDAIRAQVTAVTASTPDDVTLTLGGTNTEVVWGSAEASAYKALALEKIMAARPPAGVSVYDVSSPSAIVVR